MNTEENHDPKAKKLAALIAKLKPAKYAAKAVLPTGIPTIAKEVSAHFNLCFCCADCSACCTCSACSTTGRVFDHSVSRLFMRCGDCCSNTAATVFCNVLVWLATWIAHCDIRPPPG